MPPYDFRSVMAMMIIPLPHYDNLSGKCLKSEKKCVGAPPPPPPPNYTMLQRNIKGSGSHDLQSQNMREDTNNGM